MYLFDHAMQQPMKSEAPLAARMRPPALDEFVAQDVPVMPLFHPDRFVVFKPDVFDAWYYTSVWNLLQLNKHSFVTGRTTGLEIRSEP